MFSSILESSTITTSSLSVSEVLLCTGTSLVLGLIIALIYMFKGTYTKSFIITLIILPAIVQAVIMVVNGNLGTGVAVMGAFSLIRFRSAPGSSKEISAVFLAMCVGIATGMGYITFAATITLLVGAVFLILNITGIGDKKKGFKELKVTIPENLNYTDVFDDLFEKYCSKTELVKVKTTNLGSMFDLTYRIVLKDLKQEKEFIDDIRARNGNLTVICSQPQERGIIEEL